MWGASSFLFIKDIEKKELLHLLEENQRMIGVLTEELFTDATVLEGSQIIEGPYGFGTSEIKKIQKKFAQMLQGITGKDMVLLNIYNSDGRIISSNFSEFEGQTAEGLGEADSVNNILAGGKGLIKLIKLEDIHPQLFWKGSETERDAFEIYVPIVINGETVGVVESYFAPKIELRGFILSMLVIVGIGILITIIFIYLFFIVYIIRPLSIIRKATHPIGKGEFMNFIKSKHNNHDEIGALADDFNKMLRGLNSLSGEITRLKEVGKMKSEFISIVAHQLRTPLTGIKWVLETISEKEFDVEIKGWLKKVQDLNDRMIEIVNDFLNASRIEKGKMGYVFQENVDLVKLLNKVIEIHKINIEHKHLSLSFPQHNSPPVHIKADEDKLITAFDNLLDNAINYTAKNGIVSIGLTIKNDFVIVNITDTGIGIEEEDLSKLFTRFFRSKKARTVRPAGSGLGLFIVKNIIRDHDSTIRVESKVNKGTSFYVKLPVNNSVTQKGDVVANK